ncbi:unnamed protein product [Arabis nemorensis]|uniref:Uncharacterized protein n=1 Tax=Arabis nemorensis TaxID=586526 RepID=A0A565B5T2_9BRAS|nr:unnamed protein product [Arabis nemorensis]
MSKNLRSVVAQVARGRKSVSSRRSFSTNSNPTTESKEARGDAKGIIARCLLFGVGFWYAGPLILGDPVAEVEQRRQKNARLIYGDSAEIGDMREKMWSDLGKRMWVVVAGKSQSS